MKHRILCLLLVLCTVCLLAGTICVSASEPQLPCVMDAAELLTQPQTQRLEQMAQAVTKETGVGVYMVSVSDYREIDPAGVYEATYGIYHAYTMGEGAQRDGIMLLLSVAERDYAVFCYGKQAEYAFNDYGVEKLTEKFLDNFAENDWNGGFEDYIRECAVYLEKAEVGKPVRKSPVTLIILFSGISLLIAFVVCAVLVGQMKTVQKKTAASAYADTVKLTEQYERFTHRTETRRKIQRSNSSSGSAGSSEVGGGGSGKF